MRKVRRSFLARERPAGSGRQAPAEGSQRREPAAPRGRPRAVEAVARMDEPASPESAPEGGAPERGALATVPLGLDLGVALGPAIAVSPELDAGGLVADVEGGVLAIVERASEPERRKGGAGGEG